MNEPLATPVTEHDVPEAGEAIDVLLAVGIHEHRTAGTDPHTSRSVNGGIVLRINQRHEVPGEKVMQSEVNVSSTASV